MKRWITAMLCIALSLTLCFAGIPAVTSAEADGSFYDAAELLEIKSHIEKDAGMSLYATVQGACTDGRYAYFAVQEGETVILKYDMKNWKLTKKASVAALGHANDMCYNSKRNCLVVANNYVVDDVLTLVDPDSLEVISTVTPMRKKTQKELKTEEALSKTRPQETAAAEEDRLYKPIKVYSVAYRAAEDCYVVGLSGSYNFAYLDKDFKQLKQFKGQMTGYTRQGIDCDDDYIYFTQSDGDNLLVVYDFQGRHVQTLTIGHSHEVENLFHVGRDFFLTLHYYGNSVRRVGFSHETRIAFDVNYRPGGGTGSMAPTRVHYGEPTKLSACTYTKPGYFFAGWKMQRSIDSKVLGYTLGAERFDWLAAEKVYDDALYPDRAAVAKLTRIGSITLTASWIAERYTAAFDSGTGEGWMAPDDVAYDETYTVPENQFTRTGYVFTGYTLWRDCDGRAYGYYAGSDKPRWLEPQDMIKPYLFEPGEQVSRLCPEGTVTFTAQFTLAFLYNDDHTALLSYIGSDEEVEIPGASGALRTIASGAFADNPVMTALTVPPSVEELQPHAVAGCTALDRIVFEGSFPSVYDRESVTGSGVPLVWLKTGDQLLLLGCDSDRHAAQLIINRARALERAADAAAPPDPPASDTP